MSQNLKGNKKVIFYFVHFCLIHSLLHAFAYFHKLLGAFAYFYPHLCAFAQFHILMCPVSHAIVHIFFCTFAWIHSLLYALAYFNSLLHTLAHFWMPFSTLNLRKYYPLTHWTQNSIYFYHIELQLDIKHRNKKLKAITLLLSWNRSKTQKYLYACRTE